MLLISFGVSYLLDVLLLFMFFVTFVRAHLKHCSTFMFLCIDVDIVCLKSNAGQIKSSFCGQFIEPPVDLQQSEPVWCRWTRVFAVLRRPTSR